MNTKKLEELINSSILSDLLHKEEVKEKKKKTCVWIFAIIGIVCALAAAGYAVYRFFAPDYLDDFEDEFDDDFDDDFFEDEPLEEDSEEETEE